MALASILVLLFMVVEGFILNSYVESLNISRDVKEVSDTVTYLASADRDAMQLQLLVLQMSEAKDLVDIVSRRGVLARQLEILSVAAAEESQLAVDVGSVKRYLDSFGVLLGDLGDKPSETEIRAAQPRLLDVLKQAELAAKQLFTQKEIQLYGQLGQVLRTREESQKLLLFIATLVLVIGIVLAFAIRRSVRADFRRAYQALVSEVEERKSLQRQLTHQAFHDSLTGLANRRLLIGEVKRATVRAQRLGSSLALAYLDLDDFKKVNDTLGHVAGDELLRQVADRLWSTMRGGDIVARLGGDEFAVLVEDVGEDDRAAATGERILRAIREPFDVASKPVAIGVSVGIAINRRGNEDPADLLRNADMAMYEVKTSGKGTYQIFTPEMGAKALERVELEADLERAIDDKEFVLHYQPVVELATGRIVGAEALVRWNDQVRGLREPAEFIPLAEQSGAILRLGRWILESACKQASSWQGGGPLTVHVNLSARQIEDVDILQDVRAALDESRLRPDALMLEITEGVLMDQTEKTVQTFKKLKALGVRLAIDDFGTGYSSLGYLRFLPVDVIKIDKAFVNNVAVGPEEAALAEAITKMAHGLGLECVAEGIESGDQARKLAQFGCKLGQGFHYYRPMSVDAFSRLISTGAAKLVS